MSTTDEPTPDTPGANGTPEAPEITRTTHDHGDLHVQLEQWLARHLPGACIAELGVPDNGMSSETVLFEATVPDGSGGSETLELVARLAAADDAVPVFPTYDLESQYRVMDLVGTHTSAPVPHVRFLERDPAVLGRPSS